MLYFIQRSIKLPNKKIVVTVISWKMSIFYWFVAVSLAG